MNDYYGQESSLNDLASTCFEMGEYGRAVQLYEQALAIARTLGDQRIMSLALDNLGSSANKVQMRCDGWLSLQSFDERQLHSIPTAGSANHTNVGDSRETDSLCRSNEKGSTLPGLPPTIITTPQPIYPQGPGYIHWFASS